MSVDARIYKQKLFGNNFAIAVSTAVPKHIAIKKSQTLTNPSEDLTVMYVSPSMAHDMAKDLEILNEWFYTDYCQWAKRRTSQ